MIKSDVPEVTLARARIRQILPENPEQWQIITSNQRLALFMSRDWDWCHQQSERWQPLNVMPWQQWVDALWRQYCFTANQPVFTLLKPQECLQLWQAIAGHQAELAMEADQLARTWFVPIEPLECNSAQWQQQQWQQTYRKQKERKGWYDAIDLLSLLAASPALFAPVLRSLGLEKMWFAGFIEFTPLQQHCLDSLQAIGIKVQIANVPAFDQAQVHGQSWPDERQELYGAAQWALERWQAMSAASDQHDWFDGARIAVIVPNLAQRHAQVRAVFHEVLEWRQDTPCPWSLSAGLPMSDYPLMALGLNILNLVFSQVDQSTLEAMLTSKDWLEGHGFSLISRHLSSFRAAGRLQWSWLDVHNMLPQQQPFPQQPALLAMVEKVVSVRHRYQYAQQSWRAWLDLFLQVFDWLQWPGHHHLNSEAFQLLQAWHSWWLTQSQDRDCVAPDSPMTFHQAITRIKQAWQKTLFQPEAATDRILVLGLLEAAGLPIDDAYIIGLSAADWPASSRPNPLLPYEGQRRAKVPRSTPSRECWYGKALLKVYSQSCSTLIFSFPQTMNGVDQFLSPLLVDFGPVEFQPQVLDAYLPQGHDWQTVPEAVPVLPTPTGLKGMVGALRQQALCPFLGIMAIRAGLKRTPAAKTMISAADRGAWLHQVLERVWRHWGDQKTMLGQSRSELIEATAREALAAAAQTWPQLLTDTLQEVELARLIGLVEQALVLEVNRTEFKVHLVEAACSLSVRGLEFDLRIDRVDETEQGLVLIDYKTSRPKTCEQRLTNPQLILYALALAHMHGVNPEQQKAALAQAVWFVLKPADGAQWIDEMVQEHWFEQQQTQLGTLVTEIINGCSELTPLDGIAQCEQCDFSSVCRWRERRLVDESM